MTKITLNIDKLIMTGFSPLDQRRITNSFKSELNTLLSSKDFTLKKNISQSNLSIDLPNMTSTNPIKIGKTSANLLFQNINSVVDRNT